MGFYDSLSLDLRFIDSWLSYIAVCHQFSFREEAGVKGQQTINVPSAICGNATKSKIKLQNSHSL